MHRKNQKIKIKKKKREKQSSNGENLAIQAPWTSTMMQTWQTSVMCNPTILSLAYHPHAFGHLLTSSSIVQSIHLSSILQLLSHTISTYLLQPHQTISAIIYLPRSFRLASILSRPL